MRIRESQSRKRFELRRTVYVPETGTGKGEYIGSFPKPDNWRSDMIETVGEGLWTELTTEEQAQLKDWFKIHADHEEERFRKSVIESAWRDLKTLAKAIRETEEGFFSADRAQEIYEGMQEVSKELRAQGFTRSQFKPEPKGEEADPNQINFFEDSGHDRPWLEVKEEDE